MNPRHQNNYPPRSVILFRVHNMLYYTYIYIELNIPRLKKHERKASICKLCNLVVLKNYIRLT